MPETYMTKAIVLSRDLYGERNTRALVFSYDRGKLDLIVRGTQSPFSKLSGHIEPLNLVDIMVVRGRARDYIGAASSLRCYRSLKERSSALEQLGRAVGLFNDLVKYEEPDPGLYQLLAALLDMADKLVFGEDKWALLKNIFILKMLDTLGYRPEAGHCLNCRRALRPGPGKTFSPARGGVLCPDCREGQGLTISDECVKIFKFTAGNSFEDAGRLKIENRIAKELDGIINLYLSYIN